MKANGFVCFSQSQSNEEGNVEFLDANVHMEWIEGKRVRIVEYAAFLVAVLSKKAVRTF